MLRILRCELQEELTTLHTVRSNFAPASTKSLAWKLRHQVIEETPTASGFHELIALAIPLKKTFDDSSSEAKNSETMLFEHLREQKSLSLSILPRLGSFRRSIL